MSTKLFALPLRDTTSDKPLLRVTAVCTLTALSALAGCASVMAGGPDRVPVSTNPSGANVFVDNAPVGQTPMMLTLDRSKPKAEVRLELAGFEPITVVREKSINGWIFGNILIGGLIGVVVDAASGNATKFDEDPIAIGFGTNPPPGRDSDPRYLECKKEQPRRVLEARKLTDHYARLKALRAAKCD